MATGMVAVLMVNKGHIAVLDGEEGLSDGKSACETCEDDLEVRDSPRGRLADVPVGCGVHLHQNGQNVHRHFRQE